MSLPSGYKRLEYIKSSGTQYINTNLSMASGFRAEIDIEFTSLASSILSCVIGAHNDSSPYGRNFLAAQTSLFQIGMGDGYYNFGSPTTGEKYHIDFSNVYGNAYCKINGIGQTLSEAATGTNSYSVNTLYLLAVHGGESWFQKVSGNTYHCKIYSTEGTLVRDYIPCQTTAGEIGLWDDVNSVFYGNDGTGTFTAGPVVAIAADLSEVTELEHIQSSGTQYINTAVPVGPSNASALKSVIDKMILTTNAYALDGTGYGAAPYNNSFYLGTDANRNIAYGDGRVDKTTTMSYDGSRRVFTYDAPAGLITVSDLLSINFTFSNPDTSLNFFLFAYNQGTYGIKYYSGNIYAAKIFQNGTLIRDYIAAKLSDGTVGLYDKLHGLLYINVGSGVFTAGPEVPKAPSAPSGFTSGRLTDTTVHLNWTTSDGATGYKLYKNGALLATLTDTSYTDTVQVFSSTVYSVTAYNDNGESAAATLTYYAAPENPILYLVTDRAAADVDAGNEKGTYNAIDLNRVGAAMNYVADRLKAQGYDPHISPKTDWMDGAWVTPSDEAVYLGDLAELRKQFALYETTPEVPPDLEKLNYIEANSIEQILADIDALLTNIAAGWLYSGEIYSGEV